MRDDMDGASEQEAGSDGKMALSLQETSDRFEIQDLMVGRALFGGPSVLVP